ncbi:hypothetical protein SDC9_173417 [bioreactor metagenome]|uniref:Uncharacterized protein n=1 Tax=bioreactor metagenome TaxID=1076179 RepID=A0A645GH27_9ZZZZ
MVEVAQLRLSSRFLHEMVNGGREHARQHPETENGISQDCPAVIGEDCLAEQKNS